nr:delta-60 repeat domain-containing protein [Chitinophaga filiformis]
MQQDGRIIIAGSAQNVTKDYLLVRFLPNGQLDNSFGNGGVVYTDIDEDDEVTKVISLPDGSIFAAGISDSRTSVCKYHADGTTDYGFGGSGYRILGFGSNPSNTNISVQPDGKILLTGVRASGNFKVYRLKSNGVEESSQEFLGTMPDPSYDYYTYHKAQCLNLLQKVSIGFWPIMGTVQNPLNHWHFLCPHLHQIRQTTCIRIRQQVNLHWIISALPQIGKHWTSSPSQVLNQRFRMI